jgi:hypothetical protein
MPTRTRKAPSSRATRTRKAPSSRAAAVSPPTAGPLEKQINHEVSAKIRTRLRLHERDPIPEAIQSLVDAAARNLAENAVEIAVIREVDQVTRNLARNSSWSDSEVVPTSPDFVFLQDAERLATKSKALQGAGFSRDEAMRLLVAEISAGAGIFTSE